MISAMLAFFGYCCALFCWLWERVEGTEYDD